MGQDIPVAKLFSTEHLEKWLDGLERRAAEAEKMRRAVKQRDEYYRVRQWPWKMVK